MLNDKRWRQVKAIVNARTNGLCEECLANGLIVPGVDCHHIVPFESATTIQEAEALCYNPNNVRLLCIACHCKVHADAKSHTKAAHKQREHDRLERWKAKHERQDDDPKDKC